MPLVPACHPHAEHRRNRQGMPVRRKRSEVSLSIEECPGRRVEASFQGASGTIRHMHGQQHTQFIHLLGAETALGHNGGYSLRAAQHKNMGSFSPGLVGGPSAKLKYSGAIFKSNSVEVDG